jgi:RNA polymerase sigma factor for flagellar operon FliA
VPIRKIVPIKRATPKKVTPIKKTPKGETTQSKAAVPVKKRISKNDRLILKYEAMFNNNLVLTQQWIHFKINGDGTARNELIVHYVSLVRYAVSRLNLSLPSSLDRGDLNGYGTIGLMDAMEKFDLDRGLKFETYALIRIRGAIIDELRTLDWLPRSVRTKIRAVDRASTLLERELGRSPSDEEIGDACEMTAQEVRKVLSIYANTYVGTLDEYSSGTAGEGNEETKGQRLVDETVLLPGEGFECIETQFEMADKIRELEERERVVVALYYYEGLTLAEVGRVLGVTESRVCQIHTKALASLRADSTLFRPSSLQNA